MASGQYMVSTKLIFSGNGLEYFTRLSASATATAEALERVKALTASLSRSMGGFGRSVNTTVARLDRQEIALNANARAMERFAVAARSANVALGRGGNGSGGRSGSGFGAIDVAGIASGATLIAGIRGASSLQQSTLQSAIATGRMGSNFAATVANMRGFRQIALQMSDMTGQSLSDAMGTMATMASSGLSASQISAIWKPIGQFVDILHFGKDKMGYGEAAGVGAGLAHSLRLFSSGDTAYGLGRVAQLGYMSPHGTNALATQIRMFAPILENVLTGSVRDRATTITEVAAWSDRMGGLQRSGSGIAQLVRSMMSPRSKSAYRALEDLGVFANGSNRFVDQRTGSFDLISALHQVGTRYQGALNAPGGRARVQDDINALSANSARYLQLLTSKESLGALERVIAQRKAMGNNPVTWMDNVQTQLMSQLTAQTQRLTSNFSTLATTIANPLLPDLTAFAKRLADMMGPATSFFAAHPTAAKVTALGLGALGAVAAVRMLSLGHGALVGLARLGGSEHGGVMGWARLGFRGFGGEAGRGLALGGLRDLLGFSNLRGLAGRAGSGMLRGITGPMGPEGFAQIMERIGNFGGAALRTIGPRLSMISDIIARLGTRAIPVVGEVLLLIDTLRFAGKHAKDFGWILGETWKWIRTTGKDLILDAWRSIVKYVADMIGDLLNLVSHPWLIGKWFSDAKKSFDAANADAPAHQSARSGSAQRGGNVHNHFGHVSVNVHAADAHEAAKKVAELFAHPASLMSRAGSSRTHPLIGNGSTIGAFG